MKRFFVIEADTEMYSVSVREVNRSFEPNEIRYTCAPDAKIDVYDSPGPRFFGQLNALLVTRWTVETAQPIEPEVSNETV